jgi:ribosomal protein L37AE/L43A
METTPRSFSSYARRPCPQCGRTLVRRSRRRGLRERLWSALRVYPWRCEHCNHRFRAFSWKQESSR